MLQTLTIQNIVIIDQLSLEFSDGLVVITGETGAGKSIILDALGLILGQRADKDLVRKGCDQASVTAVFTHVSDRVSHELQSRDIHLDDDQLIIRRTLKAGGGGAIYINDQPASVGLLKIFGPHLVDVHSQHATTTVFNAVVQRDMLDAYGQCPVAQVQDAWQGWQSAQDHVQTLREQHASMAQKQQDLTDQLAALTALSPSADEFAAISDERALLAISEKLTAELNDVVDAMSRDMTQRLSRGLNSLVKTSEQVGEQAVPSQLTEATQACERALLEAEEAARLVNALASSLTFDPDRLQIVDDRFHEYKSLARRYGVAPEDLQGMQDKLQTELDALSNIDQSIDDAEHQLNLMKDAYNHAAETLSAARKKSATHLRDKVMQTLPSLKLEKARFDVALPAQDPGPYGTEGIVFQLAANPGQDLATLAQAASGGEFARIVLALKVALAAHGQQTLIFDEVDQGVSGAVAEAVGRHLSALSEMRQVLVITHSPQVASCGQQHIQLSKSDVGGQVLTRAKTLDTAERREVLASMLSGAKITDAARDAADELLSAGA